MRIAYAVAGLVTLLALPGTAAAGTVSRSGDVLVFSGAAGESNALAVEQADPSTVLISDAGARVAIAPGSGCTEVDAAEPGAGAQCPAPAGTSLAVDLGDGDDRYVAEDGLALAESIGGGIGDDAIEAGAGPGLIGGGAGNDRLEGGDGNDVLRGDDGSDFVRGGPGADDLDGGPGDDRVDARTGGGTDTVSCASGGDDAIVRGSTDRVEGCGGLPSASLRVPRQRIGAFFDEDGFEFRVRCADACAIAWEIVPRDRSTRRRIHQRDNRLDKERPRRDADGFPRYRPAGITELHARPVGRTTRRDIAAARLLRLRVVVTVIGRNGFERTLTRDVTLRR